MKPGWEGWRLAHLGQVSEELPKFEDNKKDEKGRHGSGNLWGRDKQRVKASPGWEHPWQSSMHVQMDIYPHAHVHT